MIAISNWTAIFEWSMLMCEYKNGHQKVLYNQENLFTENVGPGSFPSSRKFIYRGTLKPG